MYFFKIIVVCFLLFSNNSFSQNQGLLWRITSPDLKDTSYLFGTIHSIRSIYTIPASVKNSISNTEQTIVESKLNSISVLFNFRSFIKMIFNPKFKKISEFITSNKSDSLKRYCIKQFKVDESNYEFYSRFRPLIMYTFLKGDKNNSVNKYSVDDSIEVYSKWKRSKIKTLENVKQISIYEQSLPVKYEFELTFPNLVYDSLQTNKVFYDERYLLGELDDFLAKNTVFMNHSEKMVFASLIISRNFEWLPKIEKSIKKQSTFIAVGLGHLLPENYGLIDLLRAKGYTVECIMKEFK
jgi:uncharacterized protein YbaP (TraB family)